MITVHHLNSSRSQRILWLLEELGLEYRVEKYQRNPETLLAPEALRKVHPLGKSPVIEDGKFIIAESGAIIEYLVSSYDTGKLIPEAGSPAHRQYNYWLHYAEGSLMPPLLLKLIFSRIPESPMPFFIRPIAKLISEKVKRRFVEPQIKRHLDFLEQTLQQQAWFAGEQFTAADIQLSFPIEAAHARGSLDDNYPKLKSFIDRIHQRPAYQRAVEKGGAFTLLS